MGVTSQGPGFQQILNGMRYMKSHRVLVGIPEENASHSGSLTSVELAYLHSQGSPVNHIPARPFLEPAIAEPAIQDAIGKHMGLAAQAALSGDIGTAEAEMHKAGFIGENAAKSYIGSGALAPNAPITVSGGWMRNHVSGKPVHIKGKGSSAPLIDTGELRSSITHVIEGK